MRKANRYKGVRFSGWLEKLEGREVVATADAIRVGREGLWPRRTPIPVRRKNDQHYGRAAAWREREPFRRGHEIWSSRLDGTLSTRGDIAGERCSANTGNGAVEGIWEMGWGWMGPICGMGGSFEGNTMYGGDPSRRTHRGGWVGVGVRLYAWDRYLIALLRLVGHSLRPQGCNVEHIQGLRRTQRHKAAVQ